ncbi:hypothetical protein CBS147332_8388 [Penicillium roqueforti]|nr:hypothetical protein CBS147332_8388 [Penicillium roqueforti]KAI3100060.1 hypothetical protein CBS147331_8431 [Penicillium roqueforti]
MGVPYTDPAMGGLRPAEEQDIPVYGIAYLLSPDDMRKVIISEGGGIAYKAEVFTATLQNDGSEKLREASIKKIYGSVDSRCQ